MNLENEFTVPVPMDEAWAVLMEVERVAPCMPGATLLTVDGDEFTGTVKVKIGPVQMTYKGQAAFTEKDSVARRAVITASGKETRGAGTAAATVTITPVAEGETTRVTVLTDLNITGRPAQFGRGVMADVAGKLIGQFAGCLETKLGASAAAEPTRVADSPAVSGTASPAEPTTPSVPAAAPAAPAVEPAPIDLLDIAGVSVAKRLLPVLGLLGFLGFLILAIARRRARRGA
jgi:uncharacterized protein